MSAQTFHHGYGERDPRDKPGVAALLAISLHVGLILLILISSWLKWNTDSSAAAGAPTIEAALTMSAADIRAAQKALQSAPSPKPIDESAPQDTPPPPQPLPEPNPQTAQAPQQTQAQARVPHPDTKEQDEASRLAISQEKAEKEQEAKHKQEQIDLTEQIKKQQEAQQKQRLAQQQLEDQQKQQMAQAAADAEKQKKLDEIRKQREALEKQVAQAQQKQQMIAAAQKSIASSANAAQSGAQSQQAPGQNGNDNGLLAQYKAALQTAVSQQWIRPDTVAIGTKCTITIKQIPGGEVLGTPQVDTSNCAMDAAGQESLVRAVLKAQPLPYRGYESLPPPRTLIFTFQAQDR